VSGNIHSDDVVPGLPCATVYFHVNVRHSCTRRYYLYGSLQHCFVTKEIARNNSHVTLARPINGSITQSSRDRERTVGPKQAQRRRQGHLIILSKPLQWSSSFWLLTHQRGPWQLPSVRLHLSASSQSSSSTFSLEQTLDSFTVTKLPAAVSCYVVLGPSSRSSRAFAPPHH